ncbi:YihY/virulence factor BrkB family protein [Streptomyces jietaisiensis]|uniref:YihY/virulence factor BrkB family protein n=1 Tax=Streptomyces griseoaurantiacus TaxID=68213 RepID=A0ABZ1UWN5_9ACTN|nr:YihY/virulence factor BrkB family protein [Streptomyces jietaisiensis]
MSRLSKLGHRHQEADTGPAPDAVTPSGADADSREDVTDPRTGSTDTDSRPADARADSADARADSAADSERYGPDPEVERKAPDSPTELPAKSWKEVFKGTLREFKNDELTDRAAALTYYGVLSLFPALLVLVSFLGMTGKSTTDKLLDQVDSLAPGSASDIVTKAVHQLQDNGGTGSIMAVVGIVLALWSASGYIAAFIRTANAVYDVPEGRPVWKVLPLRLAVTVVLMVLAIISSCIVVFTGGIAKRAGDALGLGDTALTVWSIAKWPVLVILVTIMIAILYWSTPNAKVRGFRWITPGSLLALLIWLVASAGFAFYVANFGSYNKTYGTMAGVIVFLVWLWISNLAILLGLEFDAETARQRAVAGGLPPDEEPYAEPRDTRTWDEQDKRRAEEEGPLG